MNARGQNIEAGTRAGLIHHYLPASNEVRRLLLINLFALTSNTFKTSMLPLWMTYTFIHE